MSQPGIKFVTLDGVETPKVRCPLCGVWAYIDDDQLHGRVSIQCQTLGCDFHETVNFEVKR